MIIDGLDTNRTYTADEVVEMQKSGKLRLATLRGWFFRWDMLQDGMRMVHFTDPTANRMTPDSYGGQGKRVFSFPDPTPQMKADVEADSPIVKRTPQERLASMTAKLAGGERGQDAAAKMLLQLLSGNAGMDGLTDEQVKEITGKSWRGGDPLDAETVRAVAARYLGEAEKQVAAKAKETGTKAGRKARRQQERLEKAERQRYRKH